MKKVIFNKAITILLVTNAIILFAGAMLGPIFALFVDEVGGSLLDASLAGGAFALTAGITVVVSGRLSDRIKENELIIVIGYLILGTGFLLLLITHSIITLLIVQVLLGLGEAIYSPAFDSVYSKHLDAGRVGTEWGAWEAINYFSAAIGAVAGGLVVTWFGFSGLFIMMAVLAFASAVYIILLPRKIL